MSKKVNPENENEIFGLLSEAADHTEIDSLLEYGLICDSDGNNLLLTAAEDVSRELGEERAERLDEEELKEKALEAAKDKILDGLQNGGVYLLKPNDKVEIKAPAAGEDGHQFVIGEAEDPARKVEERDNLEKEIRQFKRTPHPALDGGFFDWIRDAFSRLFGGPGTKTMNEYRAKENTCRENEQKLQELKESKEMKRAEKLVNACIKADAIDPERQEVKTRKLQEKQKEAEKSQSPLDKALTPKMLGYGTSENELHRWESEKPMMDAFVASVKEAAAADNGKYSKEVTNLIMIMGVGQKNQNAEAVAANHKQVTPLPDAYQDFCYNYRSVKGDPDGLQDLKQQLVTNIKTFVKENQKDYAKDLSDSNQRTATAQNNKEKNKETCARNEQSARPAKAGRLLCNFGVQTFSKSSAGCLQIGQMKSSGSVSPS